MANNSREPHYITQIDVFRSSMPTPPVTSIREPLSELCVLMRELLSAQDRQNELLETLIAQGEQKHRRRATELALWKRANPELSDYCRRAANKLERVQTDLLSSITEEVEYNGDSLLDSEFGVSEFVDRFGSKFMHLNALLQVLAQLGNAPDLQYQASENARDA